MGAGALGAGAVPVRSVSCMSPYHHHDFIIPSPSNAKIGCCDKCYTILSGIHIDSVNMGWLHMIITVAIAGWGKGHGFRNCSGVGDFST